MSDPTSNLVEPWLEDAIRIHKHRPLLDALTAAGVEPVKFEVLTVARAGGRMPVEEFDAVILLGGRDIQPEFYDPELLGKPFMWDEFKMVDDAELSMVKTAADRGIPVLGICRGAQILNVALGGTLIPELAGVTDLLHHRQDLPDYVSWATSHTMDVAGSRLLEDGEYVVSSRHHQAVGELGTGLRVTGRAPDGVVEMVEHEFLPLYGVQWHPEVSYIEQADTLTPLLTALFQSS